MRYLSYFITLTVFICSCSVTKQIGKQADNVLLKDSVISTGHTGISIYEPATGKYWYNYEAEKYFVPASNVKLFTLYAGMKYLGDSIPGIKYQLLKDSSINIFPTGDPTFLHPDFKKQPVLDFLQHNKRSILFLKGWEAQALGYGWAWDDYNDRYMAERSPMPVFGNVVNFRLNNTKLADTSYSYCIDIAWEATPKYFESAISPSYYPPIRKGIAADTAGIKGSMLKFSIKRKPDSNFFGLAYDEGAFSVQTIPFKTYGINTAMQILKDDFKLNPGLIIDDNPFFSRRNIFLKSHTLYSQPSDSLFKPMMYNSDNFFAEQTLLMTSNEKLGVMNDEAIIDTLLSTDLKDVPQKPKWVDGSGLSRYNLFSPKDFIFILNKMKNEFGLERLKTILPGGNAGTLKNYFIADSGLVYAKTGSLSNHVALSGFVITKKNRLLFFSILNNHFIGRATTVRRAVEKFLQGIIEDY
ncbi:MAG: D-alanyl-D-alanine carboxypeptidase [Ferruginibacter sp.]